LNGKSLKIVHASQENFDPDEYAATPWQDAYQYAPMHGLTEQCRQNTRPVSIDNVEFRFFEYGKQITASMLVESHEALIAMINGWTNDPEHVRAFYKKAIANYRNNPLTKYLYQCHKKNPKLTLPELLKKDASFSEQNVVYDTMLLDALLVHKIYAAPDKKILFSLCGCNHHKRIKPVLYALGFQQENIYGHNALSSDDGTQSVIPALDLNTLFAHLQRTHGQPSLMDYLSPFYKPITTALFGHVPFWA
jgi:hypothetical protein